MTNTTTHTTTEISLAKLVPSPANVRRTGATAGIEALPRPFRRMGCCNPSSSAPSLTAQGRKPAASRSSPGDGGWPR